MSANSDRGWQRLVEAGELEDRLVASSSEPAVAPQTVPFPPELDRDLQRALETSGISDLYRHQLRTWEVAHSGGPGAIVTSATASGKSLAFNLPVLDAINRDAKTRGLYVYPTKALAQDQVRKLAALRLPRLRPAIYDGDTPADERPAIRRESNLVLTNPDMIHIGILPHHELWGDFLANLDWVVFDEAHVYRGVFGSHVANVIRRLRRAAALYGSEPRFMLASATIANPGELAAELTGLELEVVGDEGSPTAGRKVAMWNPPVTNPDTMVRRSALGEAAELMATLVISGMRTICFLRSRRGIELILRFTRDRLKDLGYPELAERIEPYRAGYTPADRRRIEAALSSGELLGVVATDALELGIDIGELDASICVTFPGTVASLRQMWGRAGRRSEGVAVYLAGNDALDQFFCRHPEEFLGRPVEAAILDTGNERIQGAHLLAAAQEAPLGAARPKGRLAEQAAAAGDAGASADDLLFGPDWRHRADELVMARRLVRDPSGRYLPADGTFAAGEVSLRSASLDSIAVVDAGSGEIVGIVEAERAFTTVHPGAIYLHLGRAYEVRELDLEQRRATVLPFDGDWYTQPKKDTYVFIDEVLEDRTHPLAADAGHGPGWSLAGTGVGLKYGGVSVTEQVVSFQRKRLADHTVIDTIRLDLPETAFPTRGLWYELSDRLAGPDVLPMESLLGALHAVEHAQIAVLPLLAMCDRWDIGGLSTNIHPQTGRPTIFIYDGYPGGVGIARRGFGKFDRLLTDASRLVAECQCDFGCPSCVQSPKCGNLNEPLFKQGAIDLMARMQSAIGDGKAAGSPAPGG